MFYDSNDVQLSTDCDAVSSEDTAEKYKAWHWFVQEVDGTDAEAMSKALDNALQEKDRPSLIIGHTVMGRGCVTADGKNFEGQCSTHGQPLSKSGASYEKTVEHLGGDPQDPWKIWTDVEALYEARKEELRAIVAERKAAEKKWREANPEKAKELDNYINNVVTPVDYKAISHKANIATRAASADVLGVLAEKVGNMIVSSADLANSDKTDAFLKKTTPFAPKDFKGAFLHAGVSELGMTSIINGIALHGGLIGACATFFVFSDYMKPAIRMTALMQLPVKYVWTHDSFRVGEDGPTHQPVEQEAQIRLMEELKNHSGKNSMLVLRPADSAETTVAWKMAMENVDSPTGLILTRQDVEDLPSAGGDRYADALQMLKGGYAVVNCEKPDVVLVGNGSDVMLLVKAAEQLKEEGVNARVVSVPSIGLFMSQEDGYRKALIPDDVPTYGKTSGIPSTLLRVVGSKGKISGLDHFGYSAPYKLLEEKFGFTVDAVLAEIRDLLK